MNKSKTLRNNMRRGRGNKQIDINCLMKVEQFFNADNLNPEVSMKLYLNPISRLSKFSLRKLMNFKTIPRN